MPRWIIPASVLAILVSLAALGLLLAANSSSTTTGDLEQGVEQDLGQVEEPENEPPIPEPGEPEGREAPTESEDLTESEGLDGSADQEDQSEQPLGGGRTTGEQPGQQRGQQGPLAPGPRVATIRITGGSSYYCSLGTIGEAETVQGRRPADFEVEVATGGTSLDTVMATCQKISPGTLGVRIIYDNAVVARDETNSRLGTVSVAWNPLTE